MADWSWGHMDIWTWALGMGKFYSAIFLLFTVIIKINLIITFHIPYYCY